MKVKTIDTLLEEARARLRRLTPREARQAWTDGALLIDIRPEAQRRREGEIPGAILLERNVLEWRLDPASPHRIPEVTGYDQTIILVCQEGYASSLAAASLQDLGLVNATDLDGGIAAWAASGLPFRKGRQRVTSAPRQASATRRRQIASEPEPERVAAFRHRCRYC
jgi:rhodanese-related sulfurtransferase